MDLKNPPNTTPRPIKFSNQLNSRLELPEDSIYLFDKPAGISSFGAVYQVRAKLKQVHQKKIKVGHCGTLDPIATGLLILVSGKFTKKAGEFSKMDKVYTATAKLGQSSNTYDSEGHLELVSTKRPTPSDLKTALYKFSGEIKQVPPAFSAIKIDGKRAYKLAREGTEKSNEELKLKLKPREVTIHNIKLISYKYPTVEFTVNVSSGTYIRSIINDLGNSLQTGAHMTALRRESIGPYRL